MVIEANMFSKLSTGVKNASYYNQAARNVACIAEVLRRVDKNPMELSSLGSYVLAPKSQIDDGIFIQQMTRKHIKETVLRNMTFQKMIGGKIGLCLPLII